MQLTTNDKLIAQRSKFGRYATFAGLAILLGSLAVSWLDQNNIALAYVLLFAGFILSYVGAVLANKWVKEPRADQALAKALKGLDSKNHLYNYLLPVAHVLLNPSGILVFKTKPHDGKVFCKNGKWSRAGGFLRLFSGMGQEALGDPMAELNNEIALVKKLLTDKMENAALVPVDGYVVFIDPRAELNLDNTELPVVKADDLKDVLRKSKRAAPLAQPVFDQLARVLDQTANAKTTK